MKVYRLQHKSDKLGPFRGRCSRFDSHFRNHRTPWAQGVENSEEGYARLKDHANRFGWNTLRRMASYCVLPDYWEDLWKAGFEVVAYEAPSCYTFPDGQVMFRACDSTVITKYHTFAAMLHDLDNGVI